MVTYSDLFEFTMVLIALISLCYQIFKNKNDKDN